MKSGLNKKTVIYGSLTLISSLGTIGVVKYFLDLANSAQDMSGLAYSVYALVAGALGGLVTLVFLILLIIESRKNTG